MCVPDDLNGNLRQNLDKLKLVFAHQNKSHVESPRAMLLSTASAFRAEATNQLCQFATILLCWKR